MKIAILDDEPVYLDLVQGIIEDFAKKNRIIYEIKKYQYSRELLWDLEEACIMMLTFWIFRCRI